MRWLASHQQQVAGGGGRRLPGSEEGKGQQLKVERTGRVAVAPAFVLHISVSLVPLALTCAPFGSATELTCVSNE